MFVVRKVLSNATVPHRKDINSCRAQLEEVRDLDDLHVSIEEELY
jgi:hypothetical protein